MTTSPPSSSFSDGLTRVFDRAPIGLYHSHADGRLLYCNPAFARLLGYPSVAALYAISMERDVYADPEDRKRIVADHPPGSIVDGTQVRWKRFDGSEIYVVLYGHIVSDARGVTFEASVLDATHLVAQTAQLRRQAADLERTATTLDLVVRQMPAVYWVMDRDLRITRTGGAVAEVLGYPLDTHIGRTLYEVHAMEPGDTDPITPHVRALQGEIVTFSNEYRGKLLENTIGPYRIDGEIIGAIGTAVDVTASRRLERRMVDAQRAESLGVLAGGLAHDFNNLLVAILGNADLALRDVPRGTPGRASIENIRTASLRAAELTDQLLAYAGRGVAATTAVAPRPLVEELLRIAAPSIPDNVRAAVDIPAELVLRGDPTAVRQAVLNLIGNARDAIGARGGAIAISARALMHDGSATPDDALTAAAGAYVLLEVSDDGPGMDADTRRRIFEPFFTTKASGHGLGLAAVMGIVRSHGGGLRVASEPGAGARFQVLWPASARPEADAEDLAAGSAAKLAAARCVLVVDDEDLVRDVVARMVEDLGYSVLTAADGPSALAMVATHRIDCVLVDLTMPLMNGGEVIAKLRVSHPDLPVVLVSGYDRDRRGPVSANAYLAKPFRMDALESTLAALLRPVS